VAGHQGLPTPASSRRFLDVHCCCTVKWKKGGNLTPSGRRQFNLKDLAAAEASANEAMNPKGKQPAVRAEYTLGRILEAKGDMAGAKQHMSRYLALVPNAPDAAMIKRSISSK